MDEIKSKPKTLKELMRSSHLWKPLSGILIGGSLGYLYYYFLGCTSVSCVNPGSPLSSIVFTGVLGLIISSSHYLHPRNIINEE